MCVSVYDAGPRGDLYAHSDVDACISTHVNVGVLKYPINGHLVEICIIVAISLSLSLFSSLPYAFLDPALPLYYMHTLFITCIHEQGSSSEDKGQST